MVVYFGEHVIGRLGGGAAPRNGRYRRRTSAMGGGLRPVGNRFHRMGNVEFQRKSRGLQFAWPGALDERTPASIGRLCLTACHCPPYRQTGGLDGIPPPAATELAVNKDKAIVLLQKGQPGVGEWNRRRGNDEAYSKSLEGADFSGVDLAGVDFTGIQLRGANFQGSKLFKANFTDAQLAEANLSKADLNAAILERADLTEAILTTAVLRGAQLARADLSGANLRQAELREASFEHTRLDGADLTRASLAKADLRSASFDQAIFNGAHLEDANLRAVNLDGGHFEGTMLARANLSRATLRGAVLTGAQFSGADLNHADISNANCNSTSFGNANLQSASFHNTKLHSARFQQANLTDAQFAGASLVDAHFAKSNLTRANLQGASVNFETNFAGAEVVDCRIDRHTLESLNNYGGLTPGDRMMMITVDDVGSLRVSYSGFWQWIHLAALATFLSPYLFFILSSVIKLRFDLFDGDDTIPLWKALLRFICNGGEGLDGWHPNYYALGLFVLGFLYNILRAVLLWKTKTLELQQESSGLPARFSLTGKWYWLYQTARWGFFGNLLIVILHTMHFLTTEIPVS